SIEIQDGFIRSEIATRHRSVASTDICAAWLRRPRRIYEEEISPTSTELSDYVKQQSKATLAALYESLETLWVCHPDKLRRADIKALQLVEASKAGLQTPHSTLISNDPVKATAFVGSLGET